MKNKDALPIKEAFKSVKCYDIYKNEENGLYSRNERNDLYTKPKGFFNILSNAAAARYFHAKQQREWLQDKMTFRYEQASGLVYIQWQFDAYHSEYDLVASIENWKEIRFND